MRTCVIDIPGLSTRLLSRLNPDRTPSWLNELKDAGSTVIRPALPAVTMTVQATYTTGVTPAEHGVIANGIAAYRAPDDVRPHLDLSNFADYRCNVSFWEQSNKLLRAPRVWAADHRKVALICVQSSMAGAAQVVVTPKPEHTPDGKTISLCWSSPSDLYPSLQQQLGPFPLMNYWGPFAGMSSSEWITAAARLIWESQQPDLQWVYVPQMDYDLQKFGPADDRCVESLLQLLGLLTPLVEKVEADGGRPLLLSEYGMTPVTRSCPLNVHLRKARLLTVDGQGEVDYKRSDAFAMCDHQVAHIYCTDDEVRSEAERVLFSLPEVDQIYGGKRRAQVGLNCDRAGDLVVFAKEDAWFEYRWFDDFTQAPPYAWKVDIHSKPGYDPTEMFADPKTRRICADQPQLVKGSHGALPADQADWPILLGAQAPAEIDATDVAALL